MKRLIIQFSSASLRSFCNSILLPINKYFLKFLEVGLEMSVFVFQMNEDTSACFRDSRMSNIIIHIDYIILLLNFMFH
jgi:hypothetical protein